MRLVALTVVALAGCVHQAPPPAAPVTVDVPDVAAPPLQVATPAPAPITVATTSAPAYDGPLEDLPPADDEPVYGDIGLSSYSRIAGWQALHDVSLAHCSTKQSPRGGSVAVLTIAASGHVTAFQWSAGPYAGTPTGNCIEQAFLAAKMPKFKGLDVHIGKIIVLP